MTDIPARRYAVNRDISRGADDGIRTRDPHLGKVMRYQLRHIRIAFRFAVRSPGCEKEH